MTNQIETLDRLHSAFDVQDICQTLAKAQGVLNILPEMPKPLLKSIHHTRNRLTSFETSCSNTALKSQMKKSPSQERILEEALSEVSPHTLESDGPPFTRAVPSRTTAPAAPVRRAPASAMPAPPPPGPRPCRLGAPRRRGSRGPRTQRGAPGGGGESGRPGGAAGSAGPETGNAAEPISEFSVCWRCKKEPKRAWKGTSGHRTVTASKFFTVTGNWDMSTLSARAGLGQAMKRNRKEWNRIAKMEHVGAIHWISAPAGLGKKPQNKNAISLLIVLSPCSGPWF